ncbi:chitinase 2 [Physcomitrium patens]|uniref:Uncharacterized protein n=1 Tax=Physcomitrium patens TaxID=3218 RepID=A0A2K1KDS7_PHYPA|nr:chitinase 2-like [Physcomitrium patens]PNR51930.1 hypothetical protein PHYPA_008304 [Physcomitrium patens]|eukprot:XP_024377447.1 chitinase 2-like [Physcomitrella patens]
MTNYSGDRRPLKVVVPLVVLVFFAFSEVVSAQTCGSQAGGAKCQNNLCCSQYGYCGQTSAYCDSGCQTQCSYAAPKGLYPGRMLFDYLGSNGVAITYNDIPVTNTDVVWVLGLSFAIDMSSTGATQNGVHSVYWNNAAGNLTPAAAKSWRQAHNNGRIVIAIGGSQLYTNSGVYNVNWYDPANTTRWLQNAVSSITTIVNTYGADGIDIDLERFPTGTGSTFQSLIGGLITTLKNNGVIKFVSVAPGYDQLARYTALYNAYSSYIDTVNYQFYGEGLDTCAKYKARYAQVIQNFPSNIVGLSTQVAGDPNTITGQTFINCVQDIKTTNSIAGVYLWNADISKQQNNNFAMETSVAAIL